MADVPLSRMDEIARVVALRDEILALLKRRAKLVSVRAYYGNGEAEAESLTEVLPDSFHEPIRDLLVADANAQLAAIDAELRALGIDPDA